jgi:outer membrane lipoprotein-sorting protein
MATTRTLSPRLRWAVPAGVAVAVAAAFTVPSLLASASSDLPEVTPSELLASVAEVDPVPLSGTVVYTARLGLPDLPLSEMHGAGPLDLLGGSSTIRVWTDAEDRSRAALLGATSEYSVVRDGPEAWTYSSSDDEVVHYTVAPDDLAAYDELAERARTGPDVDGDLPTPAEAADALVAYASLSTDVTVEQPAQVAGRATYQLSLTPRSDDTLVDRVLVAVDGETRTPLRVQVWSTSDRATPALEIGFTDVAFAAPDASVFEFTPPAGATTREVEVPLPDPSETHVDAAKPGEMPTSMPEGVAVSGFGWETVVELDGVDVDGLLAGDPAAAKDLSAFAPSSDSEGAQELYDELLAHDEGTGFPEIDAAALFEQLTTDVPEGRLLSSALLSVLVTDDGRVLAGAVPPQTLRDLVDGES